MCVKQLHRVRRELSALPLEPHCCHITNSYLYSFLDFFYCLIFYIFFYFLFLNAIAIAVASSICEYCYDFEWQQQDQQVTAHKRRALYSN